jgi:glycosyltransferase involved in cell wall biosynthesis
MDVFVAPTVHESFGVSMLEAMSCGKTIVATDIPSYREIDHQSDTIQFIAQRDDKLLADKLMYLYLNKELCNQLGQKSRELVLRYYDQRIIDKTIVDFYRNV